VVSNHLLTHKTDAFWANDTLGKEKTQRRQKRPHSTWKPSRHFKDTPLKYTPKKYKRELTNLVAPRVTPRFVKRDAVLSKGKMVSLSRLSIPLRSDRDQLSAQSLQGPIAQAARKYKLPQSLLLSMIKNESAFNPRARSHANALGLMQLVPTSGGKEAYSYLMGHEATPGPEVLYDPHENILLGATYLHLLNTRYFGKVKDIKTRQFLIIAAYNTGAGNVAKAFTGEMKLTPAIHKINQMSANDVYRHLKAYLPYAETHTYLARVTRDIKTFADWDTRA